jgi:uncharacterized protein YqjF (DUF2071 family)
MNRPFLTAEWRNLFLATYAIPPALIQPRLPSGLELDTRNGDAFVSLVAFQFLNTRVLGVPWPGYRNFTELNLRFYVRHGGERGVVFVREFVPQRLVAWMAWAIYNEPYRAAPLTTHCQETQESRTMEYRLTWAGREHVLRVTGRKPGYLPEPASDEHFFKEHHWGFGRTRRGQALRYEVAHPVWEVLPVQSYHVEMDWALVYGPEWSFLSKAAPMSTVFAVGSAIAVSPKGQLVGTFSVG